VTESVFGWPGIGRLAVQAAQTRDYPLVMGLTLMAAVMVVVINLLVDLLYAVVDPRVRREGTL
jgi:peptide/nickel transport system permease protein